MNDEYFAELIRLLNVAHACFKRLDAAYRHETGRDFVPDPCFDVNAVLMNDGGGDMKPATLKALLDGDLRNAIIAETPGGIEKQEAQGKKDFVSSATLPKEFIGCSREQFEQMGIVFGDDVDDLFVSCTLPEGWVKRPTSHSMHSDLIDDKGRVRAGIFYNAAFYDKRAHLSINRRFSPQCSPEDNYKTEMSYEKRNSGKWYGVVTDNDNIVFRSDPITAPSFGQRDNLTNAATAWLKDSYPEWEDPLAYWD